MKIDLKALEAMKVGPGRALGIRNSLLLLFRNLDYMYFDWVVMCVSGSSCCNG